MNSARWCAALGAAALVALGCVSSRGAPTEAATGNCSLPLGATVPGSVVVVIRNFAFDPATVTIRAGDRVTWLNCDAAGSPAHTSTSDAAQWDSGSLTTGQAFTRQFDAASRYDYHCEPHPFMKGSVIVQ